MTQGKNIDTMRATPQSGPGLSNVFWDMCWPISEHWMGPHEQMQD
jgi:hypothetical protein